MPLGITIVGGLLLSQLLTLYTTPVDLSRAWSGCARAARRPMRRNARERRRPRCGAAEHGGVGHGLLRALHPAAGRHHAARRSASCSSASSPIIFLPVASLPAVEFPTIRVIGEPARRRPGDHGGHASPRRWNGGSARSPASPRSRRRARSARPTSRSSSISSRNIDGAARDVQAALNAATADLPSDLPTLPTFRKANPAAAPILILALTSDDAWRQRHLRRRRHGASRSASRRSTASRKSASAAPSSRPSACASTRARSPRWASASKTSAPPSPTRTRWPRSASIDGDRTRRFARRQRAAARRRRITATSSCKTPNGNIVRLVVDGADVEQGVRNTRSAALVQRPARRCCSSSPSRPTPTSSRRSTGSTRCCPS